MGAQDEAIFDFQSFDIDRHTGFVPPSPPLSRLPEQWEPWEELLSRATAQRLRLFDSADLSANDRQRSASWREDLPVLPTTDLQSSEYLLRRAHHVLTWIVHFYINTLALNAPVIIPRALAIPTLEVSQYLNLPPILTYSDDVLYNWKFKSDNTAPETLPTPQNITVLTTFSGTPTEEHFYLTSTYIELGGAVALQLMACAAAEASLATSTSGLLHDPHALMRIATLLRKLASVIGAMKCTLDDVRNGCDPDVFYHQVRPWFKGMDAMSGTRPWVFEGVGEQAHEGAFGDEKVAQRGANLRHPTPYELNGPSAGQSTLVYAINIFLGIEIDIPYRVKDDKAQPADQARAEAGHQLKLSQQEADGSDGNLGGDGGGCDCEPRPDSFLLHMQMYMPRQHRAFLKHLAEISQPLRALVTEEFTPNSTLPIPDQDSLATVDEGAEEMPSRMRRRQQQQQQQYRPNSELREAYNAAVNALRAFRDVHMSIVSSYIVKPARRTPTAPEQTNGMRARNLSQLKGTGGTNAMAFLKHVRNLTANAVLQ